MAGVRLRRWGWPAGTSTLNIAMYIHQNTVSFLDLGYGFGTRRRHVRTGR
jgi:hypothetical protein